jgi:hypothetical protein
MLFSCNSKNNLVLVDEFVSTNTDTININFNNLEKLIIDSIVQDLQFIELETTEKSIIGEIDKIKFVDNKYYILDEHQRKCVFVFDDKGKFLYTVGQQGRGPGEYIQPNDFVVTNSEIVILDGFGKKFIFTIKMENT